MVFMAQIQDNRCLWKLSSFSCIRLFATPRTVAHQAPLSTGFPRQEYWSGLSFSAPGDLPDPRIEPRSLASPALPGVWLGGTISKVWLMRGEFDCWHETLLIADLLSPVTTISDVPTCNSSICLVWSENWVEQSHKLTQMNQQHVWEWIFLLWNHWNLFLHHQLHLLATLLQVTWPRVIFFKRTGEKTVVPFYPNRVPCT